MPARGQPRFPSVPGSALELRVLGPFEVLVAGQSLPLRRRKHRSLLALLALRTGRLVPTDVLVEELWGEHPPRTAREALHNYVSLVRGAIGADVLQTRDGGYVLALEPGQVDVLRFDALVDEALRTAVPEARAAGLRDALALWRGAPLADLAYEPFALREAPRLEALELRAREALIDAELELGWSSELVPELERLLAAHPFHEHLYAQLMLSLYRAGRQGEALSVYGRARLTLDELGIDPGQELRRLEQAILRQAVELEDRRHADAPQPRLRRARVASPTARSLDAHPTFDAAKTASGILGRLSDVLRPGGRPVRFCTCEPTERCRRDVSAARWAHSQGEP